MPLSGHSTAFPLSPRDSMVECTLATNGVVDPAIQAAYRVIPRELFVHDAAAGSCYADRDIDMGEGRFLLNPLHHARMVAALNIKPGDKVLDVGGTTGYSAAVLAALGAHVVALENNPEWHHMAFPAWLQTEIFDRINAVQGNLRIGWLAEAPYDAIIVNGAVMFDPVSILGQLKPGGRLACIKNNHTGPGGQGLLFTRSETGALSSRILFDGSTPYLPGFDAKDVFIF